MSQFNSLRPPLYLFIIFIHEYIYFLVSSLEYNYREYKHGNKQQNILENIVQNQQFHLWIF